MSNEKLETSLATDAIKDIIKNLNACEKTLKDEKSESSDFGKQIKGLQGLFKIVDELVKASLFSKGGKVKEIKAYLEAPFAEEKCSKDESAKKGTEYLGKLFNISIYSKESYDLAKSITVLLGHLDTYSQGFFVKLISALSKTAGPRIKVLVDQLPQLQNGVKDYDRMMGYQNYQSGSSSLSSSSALHPSSNNSNSLMRTPASAPTSSAPTPTK